MANTISLALIGVLLLTMPLYAVVSRGRPLDPEVAKRPKTILLGTWIRDWLMWVIAPMERGFVRAGLSPDVFNFLGALLGLAAGVAFASSEFGIAGWLILLGGAADIFDGRIARARGLANQYGEFLDSTLDRFSETFAYTGLALELAHTPWMALATVLALGGSMLVSYTRAKGEALGASCKGGIMQRAERLVLLALAALLDSAVTSRAGWRPGTLLGIAVAVIGVGSIGTAMYRTWFIARALKAR
ncbi:MAG: CDP-alcohol phosphatidyltransferase family protein [Gemmatimonadaceae bacterium]